MFQGLENLTFYTVQFSIFLLGSTVFPGFLFIYIRKKGLFKKLDFLKLFILSCAITFPVLMFNLCITTASELIRLENKLVKMHKMDGGFILIGCIITALQFYIISLLQYFWPTKTVKGAVVLLIIGVLISSITFFVIWTYGF